MAFQPFRFRGCPMRPVAVEPPRVLAMPDGFGGAVIDCPHCGRQHHHGWAPGHRVAHCADGYDLEHLGYIVELGTTITNDPGRTK